MRGGLFYGFASLLVIVIAVGAYRIIWPHNHLGPPKFGESFDQSTTHAEDENLERQFNMRLNARFPKGSEVGAFKAELLSEGFYLRSTLECETILPNTFLPEPWKEKTTCRYPPGPHQMLQYEWEHQLCAKWIVVEWADDGLGHLTKVAGHYGIGCW